MFNSHGAHSQTCAGPCRGFWGKAPPRQAQ
jgi:hypothetical protein